MTRDDIIRMAREAGLAHFYDSDGDTTGITDASLIDADKDRDDDRLVQILMPFTVLVVNNERQFIIKFLESLHESCLGTHNYYKYAANRIRDLPPTIKST